MVNLIVPALWILFDVFICLRTGYMTAPFSRAEWLAWLLSGIMLAAAAVLAGWWDRRRTERESDGRHAQVQKGQDTLASGIVMLAGMVQASPNQTPGEITQAAIHKIGQLESTLNAYQSILWAPLNSEQKSTLIEHLKELGSNRIRVSNSDNSDCVELARDLRECFEHAQWNLEKLPDSDKWGSAVANGLMVFGSQDALRSGVVRALAAAIPGSPILLYKLQEGDDVDVAIIVGTRKLRQS